MNSLENELFFSQFDLLPSTQVLHGSPRAALTPAWPRLLAVIGALHQDHGYLLLHLSVCRIICLFYCLYVCLSLFIGALHKDQGRVPPTNHLFVSLFGLLALCLSDWLSV